MPQNPEFLSADGLYFGDDAPFQVLPPLSEEDYRNLKADIEMNGVLVPVELDEDGTIIDGHHRVRVCQELGITPPIRVREGLGAKEKRAIARSLNVARRHLDTAAKRAVIAEQLRDAPELSNRAIARDLGVSDKTVGSVRDELGLHQEQVTGLDGKSYNPGARRNQGRNMARHISVVQFDSAEDVVEWRRAVRALRQEGEIIGMSLLRVLKAAVDEAR